MIHYNETAFDRLSHFIDGLVKSVDESLKFCYSMIYYSV